MLIFSCPWQKYRHFLPGQNTPGLCGTFLAVPDLEIAIIMTVQAEADRSWQIMGSKHSFPSLWILNIQGRYALKSQSRPQICWITPNQLQSIVSPWKIVIDSWLLSQSFHVMRQQPSLLEASGSSQRKPTQREPSHGSRWLSDTNQY